MSGLERLSSALSSQEQILVQLSTSMAPLSFVVDPLLTMTRQAKVAIDTLPSSVATTDAADVWASSDKAVEKMLLVAQAFGKDERTDDNDDRPACVASKQTLDSHIASLRLPDVEDQLRAFAETLACSPLDMGESPSQAIPAIQQLLPYLAGYASRVDRYLSSHASWSKALYKLDYVLVRTFTALSAKGFCKPQEADDQKGSGQEGQMQMDGTGLGSGTGENNVSNEIEDESQVEGLRGEEEQEDEDQPKDRDGDNDAVEMQDDFEGALEDAEEEDKDDQKEGDDEEDDEDKQDMDEHVGDVAEDAVDDQFWGDDEDDKKDESGNDQLDKNQKQEQGESEMAAKEEEASKSKDRPEQQGEDDGAEEQPDNEEEIEGEQEDQGEDEAGEEGAGAALDSTMPEVETLDLPEEMDLDDAAGSDQLEDFEDDGMEGEDVEDDEGGSVQNEGEDEADDMGDAEPDVGEAGEEEAKEDAQSLLPQDAEEQGDSGETEAQNGIGAQGGLDNSDAQVDQEQADAEATEQEERVDDVKEGQG